MWYPENKQELEDFIDNTFKKKPNIKPKKINGLIVPHAGYEYSGEIAGKAFSLLNGKKIDCAVIIGPSHYVHLSSFVTSSLDEWKTPIGTIELKKINLPIGNIEGEHSIKNQVPFLQMLGIKQIIPIMVGEITNENARELARKLSRIKAVYIFSTDLTHFMEYSQAKEKDAKTINILENLDLDNFLAVDACGYYPLLVLMHLCTIKKTEPHLIEYKNSGDITSDKSSVVGYCSMWF
ncbi:MAG: AmmeMemoRadiSam system protein B [Candidatus Pacearchaeota archaeon]|jgi:hypothetical protein